MAPPFAGEVAKRVSVSQDDDNTIFEVAVSSNLDELKAGAIGGAGLCAFCPLAPADTRLQDLIAQPLDRSRRRLVEAQDLQMRDLRSALSIDFTISNTELAEMSLSALNSGSPVLTSWSAVTPMLSNFL